MFTLSFIIKLLIGLFILGGVLAAFWSDILTFVRDMLNRGREAVIHSEWNASTKRLAVRVIDWALGRTEKSEDTYVDEDDIWKMVEQGIYTESEARQLINQRSVNQRAGK